MKSAICLFVRNEAPDIAEWMAFHALLGFDTQLIFDNKSDDGTAEIIHAAQKTIDIRYHLWRDRGPNAQTAAYDAACNAYRLEFDWIAFIDSDEFFIPAAHEPINNLLARYPGWSAIAVPWAIYGSCGHESAPDGPVLQNFTRRAPPDFFPARHVKSCVRPRLVEKCLNPHFFQMRASTNGTYCDLAHRPQSWWPAPEHGGVLRGVTADIPDYTHGRINHYFTRSRAHWHAKLTRGYHGNVAQRTEEEFNTYDRNEIEDPIALRYLPALQNAIETLRHAP